MKTILLLIILSTPGLCHSQNKFWFSNKVEVGYGKAFISEQVSFKEGVFVKNTVGLGLKLKVSKKETLVPALHQTTAANPAPSSSSPRKQAGGTPRRSGIHKVLTRAMPLSPPHAAGSGAL